MFPSLFIRVVEENVTAEYIKDAFENNKIAVISKVILIPFKYISTNINTHTILQHAFIEVFEWYNNTAANNFKNKLQNKNIETKLVYNDDSWWIVEINTNYQILHNKNNKKYTTDFFKPLPLIKNDYIIPKITYSFDDQYNEENDCMYFDNLMKEVAIYGMLLY